MHAAGQDLKCAIDPRHAEQSAARALLGSQHPLVRVMDDIRAKVKQAMVLMSIIAASATAALAGVADARAALAAAMAVEVALACALAALAAAKRDHLLDIIVEGREHLPLPPVARERERLLDSRHRAQLSHSLEALRDEAEHPGLHRPSDRPLYRRRVIAAVAPDLAETARSLLCEDAGSAGIAMTERLLSRHDSPLYEENAERLRVQLRRCQFLLANGPANQRSGATAVGVTTAFVARASTPVLQCNRNRRLNVHRSAKESM
jgi:hypothetical protein